MLPDIDADVVPSIGVDISNLPIDKTRNIQIKEVGGAMMPLWPTYLKGAAGLSSPHPPRRSTICVHCPR